MGNPHNEKLICKAEDIEVSIGYCEVAILGKQIKQVQCSAYEEGVCKSYSKDGCAINKYIQQGYSYPNYAK